MLLLLVIVLVAGESVAVTVRSSSYDNKGIMIVMVAGNVCVGGGRGSVHGCHCDNAGMAGRGRGGGKQGIVRGWKRVDQLGFI